MRKDQNRQAVPYPIYPPYQGMSPMMSGVPMMPMAPGMMPYSDMSTASSCSSNTTDSSLKEEVENLKKRVSYLENNLLSNSNYASNYNSSNYQVM
jgi:hypothetical protein